MNLFALICLALICHCNLFVRSGYRRKDSTVTTALNPSDILNFFDQISVFLHHLGSSKSSVTFISYICGTMYMALIRLLSRPFNVLPQMQGHHPAASGCLKIPSNSASYFLDVHIIFLYHGHHLVILGNQSHLRSDALTELQSIFTLK